jgi:hypothetical protein
MDAPFNLPEFRGVKIYASRGTTDLANPNEAPAWSTGVELASFRLRAAVRPSECRRCVDSKWLIGKLTCLRDWR